MKLQNQVCSLEHAIKLSELGVVQHSMYGFIEIPCNGMGGVRAFWQDNKHALIQTDIILYGGNGKHKWSAFTVAEMGVMFPSQIEYNKELCAILSYKEIDNSFSCIVLGYIKRDMYKITGLPNEDQSRSAMLIHLLETGTITVEEVNQRL
jgi:hypothetical protein